MKASHAALKPKNDTARFRRIPSLMLIGIMLLAACAPIELPPAAPAPSQTLRPIATAAAPQALDLSPEPPPATATQTNNPPETLPAAWQKIRERMEYYGLVQEDYLSADYRARLDGRLQAYGPAEQILTLELHGDSYDMFGGEYSMTPELFAQQVDYLMAEDYHFVTLHEAFGFVYGWLELPARSVILTTDISALSAASLYSITSTFETLESEYGYKPHMIVFPWTGNLAEQAGITCEQDSCWQALIAANASGYFTFGSHSTNHYDMSKMSAAAIQADLQTSIDLLASRLNIRTYAIAWPYEACSLYAKALQAVGVTLAWGGYVRDLDQNHTSQLDPKPLCLPRMLPPAQNGVSRRPFGKTWQQMLEEARNTP